MVSRVGGDFQINLLTGWGLRAALRLDSCLRRNDGGGATATECACKREHRLEAETVDPDCLLKGQGAAVREVSRSARSR